ncbi:hypothetical protein GCM10020358_24830 [Amorphoplanes nipponensis]|uniref:Uncharacterized protein n=1 Tax=Actinoplanes nipponensis TaxID=135950 RepID=A0A919JQ85_9ACTN|nr:hypothetical protein [Actinoplanes nipponensis]GIE53412.1 hypothetical protein Ani05nite_69460 [Actinoplanes nipponensis]
MVDRAAQDADGGHTPAADGIATVDLVGVARSVVVATVPEQLDLLTEVATRWEAGAGPDGPRRGWTGGSVGSGIEPLLLGEVILPVLLGASAEVLGDAVVAAWHSRPRPVRRWRRRARSGRDEPVALPAAPVTLDASQAEALRSACVRHGAALGLSPEEATVLADAVYGALCRAMTEPRRDDD